MKILLLDGNSLTYRAFFALPADMSTASGQVTNAVFGFTSMLINLLKDQRPDQIVAAFDRPEPTFRHVANPEYKAQRVAAPDLLRQQMGLVRQVLEALRITSVDLSGWEADDIIATLAERGKAHGHDVVIVTGDRDSYQLVHDPHVKVLYNRRGVSDYALYDEAGIIDKTGVTPAQYVEYAALRGDPSDNLPGVPGVGEKTAAKLITTYGGLDGIFANVDAQTPKLRQSRFRAVVAVRPLSSVPVRCIQVAAASGMVLVGRTYVPTHNSSLGRLGLLTHSTAGFIDPGFSGHVTLELSNVANLPIKLFPGMKIGQVCVLPLSSPAESPYGSDRYGSRYQGQRGPTASKSYLRFDRAPTT